jgi:hypothetical protein
MVEKGLAWNQTAVVHTEAKCLNDSCLHTLYISKCEESEIMKRDEPWVFVNEFVESC